MPDPILHKPVLIDDIIRLCAPIEGVWLDGTFGAGGYSRALLAAGASKIIAIDRDPLAHELASSWLDEFDGKIVLHLSEFSLMREFAERESLDGVVLDIGVSSMQIDRAERGFSFQKDGPLDMRMGGEGKSAADLVNQLDETELADILYHYGEERQSRRIARAIVKARKNAPVMRTLELAALIENVLPRKKPHEPHPATRSFQALRIAVNEELEELEKALKSALGLLKPEGWLVVVTFHSLEDRIVKKFFAEISGKNQNVNRHQPLPVQPLDAAFKVVTKKPVMASYSEIDANARARSAKLRIAQKIKVAA